MIRFILNFIFFGIIFYLIWVYFPEAFETMVGWLNAVYDWIANMITGGGSVGVGNGAAQP